MKQIRLARQGKKQYKGALGENWKKVEDEKEKKKEKNPRESNETSRRIEEFKEKDRIREKKNLLREPHKTRHLKKLQGERRRGGTANESEQEPKKFKT